MPVVEHLQILNEPALALVQQCRVNLDCLIVQIEQWLVEVLAEPDGLHTSEFPGFEIALLDGEFKLFELGNDILLRLVDQNAIIAFVG